MSELDTPNTPPLQVAITTSGNPPVSIPSSPEVEEAVKCIDDRVCEWTVTDTQRSETVKSVEQEDALLALRSAQHAATAQPLLAIVQGLLDMVTTNPDNHDPVVSAKWICEARKALGGS